MSRTLLPVRPEGRVVVTGSLAFDQIMIFPGQFKNHILPDKLHLINISFLVSEMRKQRGGCSGNIAYTMALLGHRPKVVAAAGRDFDEYRTVLEAEGVDLSQVAIHDDEMTASCFITTDQDNNQITGFFVGAMARAGDLSLRERAGRDAGLVIIAPDDPGAMIRHAQEAREAGIPFLFDPSFQVTAMNGEDLIEASRGAVAILTNDYEAAVFAEKTGRAGDGIFDLVGIQVTTLGQHGSRIAFSDGETVEVAAAPVDHVEDPTGAGDAYRAGFAAGVMEGRDLATCARMGSVAAAYAIEHHGTQEHRYDRAAFESRFESAFGAMPEPVQTTASAASVAGG